jgi:hypothetical protein
VDARLEVVGGFGRSAGWREWAIAVVPSPLQHQPLLSSSFLLGGHKEGDTAARPGRLPTVGSFLAKQHSKPGHSNPLKIRSGSNHPHLGRLYSTEATTQLSCLGPLCLGGHSVSPWKGQWRQDNQEEPVGCPLPMCH